MRKSLAITLSGARRRLQRRDGEGNVANVQCKPVRNWNNESPLYNVYMLIKMKKWDNFLIESCQRLLQCLIIQSMKNSELYEHIGKVFKFFADLTQNTNINKDSIKFLICH
jgi:hypothetical protein